MRAYDAYVVKQAEEARRKNPVASVGSYYWENKGAVAASVANNVAAGLMARSATPVSLIGASAGGTLDGVLLKPLLDLGADSLGHALRKTEQKP